jgi:hypothetical protein
VRARRRSVQQLQAGQGIPNRRSTSDFSTSKLRAAATITAISLTPAVVPILSSASTPASMLIPISV